MGRAGVGVTWRHRCLLVPMARIPMRQRFHKGVAKVVQSKVVQRRMMSNFKKLFEKSVAPSKYWLLTPLREMLVETGAKVIRDGC